jgi:hypothetical protein
VARLRPTDRFDVGLKHRLVWLPFIDVNDDFYLAAVGRLKRLKADKRLFEEAKTSVTTLSRSPGLKRRRTRRGHRPSGRAAGYSKVLARRQSVQEVKTTKSTIAGTSARRVWVSWLCIGLASIAFGKATVVTLPELVQQSSVIAYGHIKAGTAGPGSLVSFQAVSMLKGAAPADGTIPLCNARPNTEWPDLSKLVGDNVLFLKRDGACFDLSHSYRSVIRVRDDRAATIVIKDQPDDQPFDDFLGKVRFLVARDTAH